MVCLVWGLQLFCRLSLWLCLSFFLSLFLPFTLSYLSLSLSAFFILLLFSNLYNLCYYFYFKLLYELLFLPLNRNKTSDTKSAKKPLTNDTLWKKGFDCNFLPCKTYLITFNTILNFQVMTFISFLISQKQSESGKVSLPQRQYLPIL